MATAVTDVDDWADDRPPKEEPDCPPCLDSGTTTARWWSRQPSRPCPDCGPDDWYDRLTSLRYRVWARLAHPWRRRTGYYSDEAPF